MTSVAQGQDATLVTSWRTTEAGPLVDVDDQTITISELATGDEVVGPTAVGIVHVDTGVYSYPWSVPDDLPIGPYLVRWDAEYGGDPISTTETIEVLAGPVDTYATLAELKIRLSIDNTAEDDALERALAAASRGIDKVTGRRFVRSDEASARLFYPGSIRLAAVDDFWSTTDLEIAVDADGDGVFEATWSAVGYQLEPLGGIVDGEPGWPWSEIRAVGSQVFPVVGCGQRAPLQVTAKWGWAQVPDQVKEACLVIAEEIFKLKDAPFGVAGVGEWGPMRVRANPMALSMLAPYRRSPLLVA